MLTLVDMNGKLCVGNLAATITAVALVSRDAAPWTIEQALDLVPPLVELLQQFPAPTHCPCL